MRTSIMLGLVAMALAPVQALVAGSVEDEVQAAVEHYYASAREHLTTPTDAISAEGSLQFWSSGGLMLSIGANEPGVEYESFNLRPKHISILRLSDESAVAMYYLEGSMQPKGSPLVARYMTRVSAAYVKEGGAWKMRAGHWSPVVGGGGTSRSTD